MVTKVILILFFVYLESAVGLRCRYCSNAASLDFCTRQIECSDSEECYMDQYVTQLNTNVFYGGCRSSSSCSSGVSSHLPAGMKLLNCSSCCSENRTNGIECNVELCGIDATGSGGAGQCYFCDSSNAGSGQSSVDDPDKCGTITTCQSDEICGVKLLKLWSGQSEHAYTCINMRLCSLLTRRALQEMDYCRDPAHIASGSCGNIKRAGQQVCTACCGDTLCNHGSCNDVLDRLYHMWKAQTLDFVTMKNVSISTGAGIIG